MNNVVGALARSGDGAVTGGAGGGGCTVPRQWR